MLAEELVFIKHLLQDANQTLLTCQGQQPSLTTTFHYRSTETSAREADSAKLHTFHVSHVPFREFGPIVDEPFHSLLEPREFSYNTGF